MKVVRDYPRLRKVNSEKKKGGPLVFRPTPDLREKLAAAATTSEQSLTAEIERRLEQSFWREGELQEVRDEAAGGAHNRALAFLLQRVAVGIEHGCGRSWRDDPKVLAEVATGIVSLLQMMGAFKGATMPLPLTGEHLTEVDLRWDVPIASRSNDGDGPTWWLIAGLIKSNVEVGSFRWPLTPAMSPGPAKAHARSETPPLEVLQTVFPERKATPRRTARASSKMKLKESETPE